MASTFKYFAYGSNLLEKRIHINNPTAKRIGIALLKNYRLDFNYWSNRWGGNAATIVPDDSSFVWGAVWEIDFSNSDDLDSPDEDPQVGSKRWLTIINIIVTENPDHYLTYRKILKVAVFFIERFSHFLT